MLIYNITTGKKYQAHFPEDCRGAADRRAYEEAKRYDTLVEICHRIAVPESKTEES